MEYFPKRMNIPQEAFNTFSAETLAFAQKLIQTPSLSGHENNVANLISDKMQKLRYDHVYTDSVGNVVGIIEPLIPPQSNTSSVLMNGHMDHVDPGDIHQWTYPPYSGRIVENQLWGRGSADMKAALAAMVIAGGIIKEYRLPIQNRVVVSAVVYEEYTEGLGQQIICEEGEMLNIDQVIIGEGTNLNISIGHRGRCEFEITIKGKTAHASMPDLGVNAILPVKTILEYITESREGYPTDPIVGKESIALTHISCKPGVGPIIPDTCLIKLDRRILPNTTQADLIRESETIRTQILNKYPKTEVHIQIIDEPVSFYTGRQLIAPQFFPGWIQDPNSPIVQSSLKTLAQILDVPPKIITWHFGTDGSYTAGVQGIPSIGFGPSDETQAHVPNEHVSVENLFKALEGYVALAVELTSLPPSTKSS